MAHFAEIDKNNVVLRVLTLDNAHETGGAEYLAYDLRLGGRWVQTSFNSAIRKNFAGAGYNYDVTRDAFISPKPFPSWVLNEITCQWGAPIPMPLTGMCTWDEPTLSWVARV